MTVFCLRLPVSLKLCATRRNVTGDRDGSGNGNGHGPGPGPAGWALLGAVPGESAAHCTTAPKIGPCYPYGQVSDKFGRNCLHWWDMVHSRASLPFAALIRYVANLEATGSPGVRWMP